jgi:hypothetical protein
VFLLDREPGVPAEAIVRAIHDGADGVPVLIIPSGRRVEVGITVVELASLEPPYDLLRELAAELGLLSSPR